MPKKEDQKQSTSTPFKKDEQQDEFKKILEKDKKLINIPNPGDIITGEVLSISKNEVRLDINGMTTGIVRAREMYNELDEYRNLKEGDTIEATILELDNENGEMELSFRVAGQQKTWEKIHNAAKNRNVVKGKVKEANKGGLILNIFSVETFLPVSQLSPEHYPKVHGGDKTKILEKLRKLIGEEISVKVMNLPQKDEAIIVSEKEALADMQNEIISNFKENDIVEGAISATTDFGAFLKIDSKINEEGKTEKVNAAEGLIHISEVAWQKIDNIRNYLKEGDRVKAQIINIHGAKIFLSMKKLLVNPWLEIKDKYAIGQVVTGKILKLNPFGAFIGMDKDIQGLAHISELSGKKDLKTIKDIENILKVGEEREFVIVSLDLENHRIGLRLKEDEGGELVEGEEKKEER